MQAYTECNFECYANAENVEVSEIKSQSKKYAPKQEETTVPTVDNATNTTDDTVAVSFTDD